MSKVFTDGYSWIGRRLRIVSVQSREVVRAKVMQQSDRTVGAIVCNGQLEQTGPFVATGFAGDCMATLQGQILQTGHSSLTLSIDHAVRYVETRLELDPFYTPLPATAGPHHRKIELVAGCSEGLLYESDKPLTFKQAEPIHLVHDGREFSLLADFKPQVAKGQRHTGIAVLVERQRLPKMYWGMVLKAS